MRILTAFLALSLCAGSLLEAHSDRFVLDTFGPYDSQLGHGYVYGNASDGDAFAIAVQVPEGNYRVSVELNATDSPEPVTIKAESRRLMVEAVKPRRNQPHVLEFLINVRTAQLADGGQVRLKEREADVWHWDDCLQLEFHATPGTVAAVTLTPAPDVTTVYLIGDSTVTDQPEEPWIGWGQMLPRFFGPEVAVANHAESGMALRSFRADGRLQKVLESIRPGDYLLIQFGHNDQKESGDGIGPWTSYAEDLRDFVREARAHQAHPVLLTSMKRRRFDAEGRQTATLGDYPLAVRSVAAELAVPLIDLNHMSGVLYGALGPEGSKNAFVHYPQGTFPGQTAALADNSHFNAYGGYQLARCVVEGIRQVLPELAAKLAPQIPPYDPASPDPIETISIPASPQRSARSPDGN